MFVNPSLRLSATFVAFWLLPLTLAVLVLLANRAARLPMQRGHRIVLRVLIVSYILAAIALNLWPFQFDLSILRPITEGNFVPLNGSLRWLVGDASRRAYLRYDFLHVVLLVPVGVLLPLQQRHGKRVGLVVFWALFVLALTVAMEAVQGLAVPTRGFDVDDAIAGAAGALAAVVVGWVVKLIVDSRGLASPGTRRRR